MTAIALRLTGHAKDLGGGFTVQRLLPAAQRQAVGPFLFFDHFGPATEQPGANHDVRPHPHIGLATVTYLFDGAITHRDSLGTVQRIAPGAINWMSAGRGIVHSERKPDDLADATYTNHGLQLWAALPAAHEEDAPSFHHSPADALPALQVGPATVRVLVGTAFGARSPVPTWSDTLYLDVQLPAGAALELPALVAERAVYAVDAALTVDSEPLGAHTLAVLSEGATVRLAAGDTPVRLVVIGGAPLDGRRHLYWNFVSSRRERLAEAAADWERGAFPTVPGDDRERIPLPANRPRPA